MAADKSKRRRFPWKVATLVSWHLLLVSWTLRQLYFVIPQVVEQFNGQFFAENGGWDMSAATFAGFAYVQSLVSMAIALSVLVNRAQNLSGRLVWAMGAASLMLSWVLTGLLHVYSPRLPGFDYPQFRRGVWESMLEFDGLHFLAVAFLFFVCAAVFGRGPFSLLAALCRRLFHRNVVVADATPPTT